MKRGIFGRIKMLLLEIKFDKIRPRREYWRPLGKHSDSFSVSFGSELGFEVSVSLLFFFRHCTMCILSSTIALWSKAEIQKYTF